LRQHRNVFVAALLCLANAATAQTTETAQTLQYLAKERQGLTAELTQNRKTLAALQTNSLAPEESANPKVRELARQSASIRTRLVSIAEREVSLLQEQIRLARGGTAAIDPAFALSQDPPAANTPVASIAHVPAAAYTPAGEALTVRRLQTLLLNHYALEEKEVEPLQPSPEEIAQRQAAKQQAQKLSSHPFSASKIHLNGSEGSTALANITQRLTDPSIPESRRDTAPIFAIKTRLFDTLIYSDSRSLQPVGKNHYVARVRIQPGDTTMSILSESWAFNLSKHSNAQDFIITLYRPLDAGPELHVFALEDLLSQSNPHIPAWLPTEMYIKTSNG
jgi:hypothetical protein